mgnify:CR=1 FL=1
MTDLDDYLLNGVMNGNPLGVPVPFEPFELGIAALDMADRLIDEKRRCDRLFDAACDPDAQAWTWSHLPFESLHVGSVVNLTVGSGYDRRNIHGRIAHIDSNGNVQVAGDPYGFRKQDWDETARVLVPLPIDLTTLGKYADSKETHV